MYKVLSVSCITNVYRMLEKVRRMMKSDGTVSQSSDEDAFYRPPANVAEAEQSALLHGDGYQHLLLPA